MKIMNKEPCYCCGKKTANPYQAFCDNGQERFVGRECYKQIKAGGLEGWQQTRGKHRMFAKQSDAINWTGINTEEPK